MGPKKGFTLIELLVVIAIIAMLLAILMPALGVAKERGKSTVCRARVKQWVLVAGMYGLDNNDKFGATLIDGKPWNSINGHWWIASLRPYYSNPKLRLCPSTEKAPGKRQEDHERKLFNCWTEYNNFPDEEEGTMLQDKGGPDAPIVNCIYGSVGANGWAISFTKDKGWLGMDKNKNYGSLSELAPETPFFFDCFKADIWPDDDDDPQNPTERNMDSRRPMTYVNIDRHYGNISMVSWDGACRNVGLKSLWRLKWHKSFNVTGDWSTADADWPEWMHEFKDPKNP